MAALASLETVALSSATYLGSHRNLYRASDHIASLQSFRKENNLSATPVHDFVVKSSANDSSDDEDLVPIKLSAEAQAILGEDNSRVESEQENPLQRPDRIGDAEEHAHRNRRRSQLADRQSPRAEDGTPVLRETSGAGARISPPRVLARDGSFMYKIHEKSVVNSNLHESNTPLQSMRRIRVSGSRQQTRSPPSSSKTRSEDRALGTEKPDILVGKSDGEENAGDEHGLVHPSTILRARRSEEPAAHSTMRVRRIGTGTLLNGPIRRGVIRRQSEEEHGQPRDMPESRDSTPEVEQGRWAKEPELEDLPDQEPISYGSPKHQRASLLGRNAPLTRPDRRSPQYNHFLNKEQSPISNQLISTSANRTKPAPASGGPLLSSKSIDSNRKPIFKIAALPPLESAHDQENEPPPTFKRSKPSAASLQVHEDQRSASPELKAKLPAQQQVMSRQESPSRQPLAVRSNNTPHRPAPAPPPKMSLIDAATGAGASSRSKKSVHYVLNGRTYRRLDVIGRGGSSRVFRIMAENYKIFALKRVNLDEADMAAIAGYKGEIDLLKRLENVDRVVRLFDYEVNEEKGVLSVMMELGESDFNKMLNEQLKGENARLDVTFTRHYWKEMLECVKAVHDHEIVHSDLKPANFLLVKGQLKLIDFGIAGAIQDNTVNVHRENQIGTPNYMSPESLVCHAPVVGQAAGTKLLKLGKPSDVWSLGCILYQMTYGQPPFAHITKQFERIMSIPNPKVEIQFPGTGIGGAVVPFGLVKTLRRCLQRDQTLRPTISELLSDSDPFLNPVAISPDMLGRVIGNVIGHCRKREEKLREEGRLQMEDGLSVLPRDEEMRGWPGAFYEKLKEAGREGTAW